MTIGHGEADDGGQLDVVIEKKKTGKIGARATSDRRSDCNEKIDGPYSLRRADPRESQQRNSNGGDQEIHLKAGMKLIIEAGMQISLIGPVALSTSDRPVLQFKE